MLLPNLAEAPSLAAPHENRGGSTNSSSVIAEGMAQASSLRVVFFYSPTCAYCKEAKAALAACEKRYGPRIKAERYNVAKLEAFAVMVWDQAGFHTGK